MERIVRPASRLTKMGVRPEWRVAVIGDVDAAFVEELRGVAAVVSVGRLLKDADAIFLGVSHQPDASRIRTAKGSIKPAGAVWLIRPKGSADITERAVMDAGKAAGLVDVKVVGFSSTHSALKFVIPVRHRPR